MTAKPPPSRSQDPAPGAQRFRVALVMIVRNESHQLGRALASALPWVDEALVLDTGSTDDTVALARAAGARVAHFQWTHDFAAARNAALALAGADWHLVLDADEWIAEGGPALASLREFAPTFVGALRVDSHQGEGAQASTAPSWLSRVLPGHVRYAGRIHEQPQHRLNVQRLPVTVGHSGYAPAALAAKAGRNARLLLAALREQPADAYLWYQLGKDHDVYERYADAVAAFDRAEALTLSASRGRPAWLHDLVIRRMHAWKRCGRHAQALQWAEQALVAWAESPDFFFALGDLLLDWAADEPHRAEHLLPMIEQAWRRCLHLGERPELEGAVAGRGSVLAANNLALLYDLMDRPAEAASCRALAEADHTG
ncbi:MAG TPA: glycosyltransferase [Ideonella sp.]|uniref:glycosyltransferase n=1 Tax=Ideonella sp. TaxID=1929293 RepID=UPI002C155C67|nr:glycosyltransferase [Ideonella sp.]HSI47697.1 glycosyltransferase [Ideonella sp.]